MTPQVYPSTPKIKIKSLKLPEGRNKFPRKQRALDSYQQQHWNLGENRVQNSERKLYFT